ncbi:MAG TPA: glycosyltransferase family 4 protein [Bavariicoccus seileri]|uniref:Glycosyltransferase family 4 protein n=1 Tax=Bavariicoccus seileri TaxID=549685 RepID=A0A3D4S5Q1_9ENTE|nr:glycosyltransferase [Bavariicoccus seileri]HCS93966.1 glycosyltransferase family 4 protein [Bavariicoccus seileri]
MNICIVNDNFKLGGQQKVTINLSSELSKTNNVYLYSFFPSTIFFKDINCEIKVDTTKTDLDVNGKIRRKILNRILFFKKYKQNLGWNNRVDNLVAYLESNQVDILIVNGGFLTSLVPIIKNKCPKIGIISWQHNTAEIYLNRYYKKIKNDYIYGLNKSDAVVCLTKHDQEVFSNFNNNAVAIQNPVSTFVPPAFIPTSEKDHIIGLVSRFSIEQKGIDLSLKIAKSLPGNWKLQIAGDGSSGERKEVEKMVSELEVEKKVDLLGPLNQIQMDEFYKKCYLVISTSRWEGFGLTIVEAMFYGLPIVSFDNYGPREIIGKFDCGFLISPGNIEEFLTKINFLIDDTNLYEKYRKNAQARSVDFLPEHVQKKWYSLFSSLSK